MNDSERAMKYFIIFAAVSALLLPVCGEIYGNVSHGAAAVMILALAVASGVRFGLMRLKSGFLGCGAFLLSSFVLSAVGFVVIHPAVKSWLSENSRYFDQSIAQWTAYWVKAFLLLGISLPAVLVTAGIRKLMGAENGSGEGSSMIDDAFGDDGS